MENNQHQLKALQESIDQLKQHEGMNLVAAGLELQERLNKQEIALQKIKEQLQMKQQQVQKQQADLNRRTQEITNSRQDLQAIIEDNQQYLPYLRFEELDRIYSQKLSSVLLAHEKKYWLDEVAKKQKHLQGILKLLEKSQQLSRQLVKLQRELGDLQQVHDEQQRDLRQWHQTQESEVEKWKVALDLWQSHAPFSLTAEQQNELFYRIDGLLDEEEPELEVTAPIQTAYYEAVDHKRAQIAPLRSKISENNEEIKRKQQAIIDWQSQKTPEPYRSTARQSNRENWPNESSAIPFYQGVDFIEQVPQEERDLIEGALFASGILDAIVSEESLSLADDLLIKPDPQFMAGSTLSNVLTIDPQLSDRQRELIAQILDSIYFDESAPVADLARIQKNGTYKIANLMGAAPKDYQAAFIGTANQARYRQQMIRQLETEIEEIAAKNEQLELEIQVKESIIEKIKKSYMDRPQGKEVYQTFAEIKSLTLEMAAVEKDLVKKDNEVSDIAREVSTAKNQLIRETSDDPLPLEIETFDEALIHVKNYEANLRDAFSLNSEISRQQEFIEAINEHLQDYQQEETNLLEQVSDYTGDIITITRRLEENQQQQKIVNVAELTAQLTAATEEQRQRLQQANKMTDERVRLEKLLTALSSEITVISQQLTELTLQEENWHNLLISELKQIGENSEQLRQFAENHQKELNVKTIKNLEDQVINRFSFLQDQLPNYQPQLLSTSSIELPEETEKALGEFASFNNHNQPRFMLESQYISTIELLEQLKEQRLTLRELLKKDDEALFKKIILESVGKVIRSRIDQAEAWVQKMNQLLVDQKNSSGLSLTISWKGVPATSEQDLSTKQLVSLLQKPTELLTDSDREAVSRHFQERVALAQEQLQKNPDDRSTLFEAIAQVLDYRDWFEFELKYKRANEGYQWQPLNNRRFNQFSGGEKAIAMYLPLFAATYSRYEDAGEQCPRVITLDEAFAGIDDQNIAELFKACEQLEFNYVMNSQAIFGDYPTVSSLSIYELLRPQNANFITTIRYFWDGHKKHLLLGGEELV